MSLSIDFNEIVAANVMRDNFLFVQTFEIAYSKHTQHTEYSYTRKDLVIDLTFP